MAKKVINITNVINAGIYRLIIMYVHYIVSLYEATNVYSLP